MVKISLVFLIPDDDFPPMPHILYRVSCQSVRRFHGDFFSSHAVLLARAIRRPRCGEHAGDFLWGFYNFHGLNKVVAPNS